jgi:hypothetical protein
MSSIGKSNLKAPLRTENKLDEFMLPAAVKIEGGRIEAFKSL